MRDIIGVGSFTDDARQAITDNFAELAGASMGASYYVDGTTGVGANSNTGSSNSPKASINAAVAAAKAYDTIYIRGKKVGIGATDPVSYAETIIIPATKPGLRLIGLSNGLTQGGLPQIKIGAGSTAMITVRAPGCLIQGLGLNGSGSTGGGILLDDDGSTKTAFGTTIRGCHFKNCKGHATNGKLGGAIAWSTLGGAWQVRIEGNRFYGNVCSICLIGTSTDRPKDVVIAGNVFGADAASAVDGYIYGAGGSGFADVTIADNVFSTVLPAGASGQILRYMDLTGVASGIVARNMFGGASGTYGATGDAAKIPTAVGIAGNYQDGALIART